MTVPPLHVALSLILSVGLQTAAVVLFIFLVNRHVKPRRRHSRTLGRVRMARRLE